MDGMPDDPDVRIVSVILDRDGDGWLLRVDYGPDVSDHEALGMLIDASSWQEQWLCADRSDEDD